MIDAWISCVTDQSGVCEWVGEFLGAYLSLCMTNVISFHIWNVE